MTKKERRTVIKKIIKLILPVLKDSAKKSLEMYIEKELGKL